jgi:hypothetical protein
MKSSRQRITLLHKKINEIFPDDSVDLYGFAGISKKLILESLSESYDLLNALEEFQEKLEAILLERRIADLFEKANGQLRDRGFEKRLDEFNDFLNTLAKIRFSIKESYITLAKDPIRTELEIKKAKDDLVQLSSTLLELKGKANEIDAIEQDSKTFVDDLKERQKNSIANENKINEFLKKAEDLHEKADGISDELETWKEDINKAKDSIESHQGVLSKIAKEIGDQKINNDENSSKITSELKRINELNIKNSEQQTEIQKTIEDANRLGMAGAFKKRKDELRIPLIFWTTVSIITLVGLVGLSYSIVQDILRSNVELNDLIVKIPIFASSVWLGWFAARQFGYVSRIREDYSYKYAVSMAFEGYKNATREIDKEMLKQLLQLTIFNISKNPIDIYDSKNNHGTPYSEMLEKILNRTIGKEKGSPTET